MTPREEVEDAVSTVESAVAVSTVSSRVRPTLSTQVSTVWQRRQNAVCVRRACKRYGTKKNPQVVLDQLNMTVPKGTIYGLLGASGCGKTTLLTCIVGRRRLNTGEIWVLGGKPGSPGSGVPGPRVGYMPQEIALYGEFSIRETMVYFGWIFGLTIERIEERLKFLLKFLELPTSNRLVKNLSGGQQRRVSFAAALLHDPELLILDEPTVGVDPVLRQSIWEHLVAITKDGNKTVIITTHYIEEARQAHAIGLMRGGRLLAEQSPDALLATFGCSSLEDVFLQLSREQNDRQAQQRDDEAIVAAHRIPIVDGSGPLDVGIDSTPEPKSTDPKAEDDFVYESEDERNGRHWSHEFKTTCTSRYKALLWKNFMWMWRNPGIMLFIIGLPMVQVVLFCVAVGHDPAGLKLAVVNHDSAPGPLCPILTGCNLTHLSCRYLGHLGEYPVVQEPYGDVESAKDAVRLGHAWGAIYFTENYTDALVARGVLGKDADNETLDQSEMRVWLDLSNKHIGLMLQRYMHQSYESFLKDILTSCKEKPQFVQTPVKFLKPVYGPAVPNFTDFAAPGVMLTIVFFLAVALMSGAMIIERLEGLMERSLVAGITPTEMLMSHVICQFLVMSGQSAVVIIFSLLVFNITCEGPVIFVIIILLLQGMCGMCFGMLISCLCENERSATYLGLGSFLPIVMLCGIIWPVEGMNYVLRTMSSVLPLTYPTESLRSILARGWSIEEPVVYHGFICIGVWIVIFLTASVCIIKFKKG